MAAGDYRHVAERVRWILANKKRSDGRPWKPSSLALAAGLSKSGLSNWLDRVAENPSSSIKSESLRAVASVSGVSAAWLIDGSGTPDSKDPKPTAEDVFRLAAAFSKISPAAIEATITHDRSDGYLETNVLKMLQFAADMDAHRSAKVVSEPPLPKLQKRIEKVTRRR